MRKEIILTNELTDISNEIIGFKKITFVSREPRMSLDLIVGNRVVSIAENQQFEIEDSMIINKKAKSIVSLIVYLE